MSILTTQKITLRCDGLTSEYTLCPNSVEYEYVIARGSELAKATPEPGWSHHFPENKDYCPECNSRVWGFPQKTEVPE